MAHSLEIILSVRMDKTGRIRYSVHRRYTAVKNMRKTLWTALLVSLMLCLSASRVQAVTIGELLGWLTSDEDSYDAEDSSTARQDAEDTSDDYYMSLDVSEDGEYDTKDEVCAYLVQYHELPSNYMTKKEARKLGWEGGALNRLIDGMAAITTGITRVCCRISREESTMNAISIP